MRVSFGEIRLGDVSRKNLDEVISTNRITMGAKVKAFEEKWGTVFGFPHNVAVSSGTDADTAACMTLYNYGAKRWKSEIIVPALAFASVGNSIISAGFKPVFVDIERETLNINPKKIEDKITKNTIAIMPVHTMGKPCEMDKIMEIAKKNNLSVIEDSCEAHGAKYNGRFIGHFGDMSAYSGYTAHLVQTGEGGMVSTFNSEFDRILRSIRDHGREGVDFDPKYFNHVRPGLNLRMNELEASIGLESIENFESRFNKRKKNLYYLLEQTKELGEFAHFNIEGDYEVIAPHAFSLTLKHPKFNFVNLYKYLRENNISCKRNFGSMPTQHLAFKDLGYKLGDFPESEYVGNNGLHFGIHEGLGKEEMDYAAEKLFNYFKCF